MDNIEKRNANAEKRNAAERILADPRRSDDKKLFEIFELYKDDLRSSNVQLYYALLGWTDAHISELVPQPAFDYFKNP